MNIGHFAGGTMPWKKKSGTTRFDDGLLDVISMDNVDMTLLKGEHVYIINIQIPMMKTEKDLPQAKISDLPASKGTMILNQ